MSGRGGGRGMMNNNNYHPGWMPRDGGGGDYSRGGLPPQPPPSQSMDYPPPSHYRGGSGSGGGGDYYHARGGDYRGGGPPDRRGSGGGGRMGGPPPPYHRGPPPFPPPHRGGGGGGGGGGDGGVRRTKPPPGAIIFHSYEEERNWVEERRRKRQERPSKFDLMAPSNQNTASGMILLPGGVGVGDVQQTRHARRIYVGNLPPAVTEEQIHDTFKKAIETAWIGPPGVLEEEDPILSVYINHERSFSFVEFKTVEMTTACMSLDGLEMGGVALKIKRPNDYIPSQVIQPPTAELLDVSRLGIISSTVADGPNKIFIGGLHYHLTDAQVLELVQAFGKVKAFHLVKNDTEDTQSKGYCFVEYADPVVTPIAIEGLNGMEIGGGKSLTARLAGGTTAAMLGGVDNPYAPAAAHALPSSPPKPAIPPPNHTIVCGYDVEELVDAALGNAVMPTAPVYVDAYGNPLTRIVPIIAQIPLQQATTTTTTTSRILVLKNMVTASDLATDDDYYGLKEEVTDECTKYGALLSVEIPRHASAGTVEQSAVQKIYLEYANPTQAAAAAQALQGRTFGDNIVQTEYYDENDYLQGRLR